MVAYYHNMSNNMLLSPKLFQTANGREGETDSMPVFISCPFAVNVPAIRLRLGLNLVDCKNREWTPMDAKGGIDSMPLSFFASIRVLSRFGHRSFKSSRLAN
jgi:hypothetical protein